MADRRDINPISPGERTVKNTTPKPESVVYTEDVGGNLGAGQDPAGQGGTPVIYGHSSDGGQIPDVYKVKITSYRNNAKIIGLMQDDIQLKVSSRWEPIVPTNALAIGNILTQVITKGEKSLISKAVSRRIWAGASPIVMSLNLKFEAVVDAKREVLEPCRILQSLALPSEYSADPDKAVSKVPLLGPPGPTPFMLEKLATYKRSNKAIQQASDFFDNFQGGDLIVIELGSFVTFWNVIVSEVTLLVPPKFTREGDPISATVSIIFETYEMPTVESLKSAYNRASLVKGVE
jgi:hypothetical protein